MIDLIFPPLCLACREECRTRFLCPSCWQLCLLPDPVERCRHCFEELDRKENLCSQCRKEKILPAIRAYVFDPESPAHHLALEPPDGMASFALIQWVALDWPLPDAVIPMPDRDSVEIGRMFAFLLNIPFMKALRANCDYKEDRLEEGKELLLFDVSHPVETLQKATLALSEAFPKRIYLLSLVPYAAPSI